MSTIWGAKLEGKSKYYHIRKEIFLDRETERQGDRETGGKGSGKVDYLTIEQLNKIIQPNYLIRIYFIEIGLWLSLSNRIK
jgi:hypothetical protein